MPRATQAASELSRSLGDIAGSLRMFGDWFGKPYDNLHRATSAVAEDDALIVTFDQGETLRVVEPVDWSIGPEGLKIRHATRVVWQWHYYGRPPTPENLYTIEHLVVDAQVRSCSDVDWYTPDWKTSIEADAVEVVRPPGRRP